MAKQKTYQVTTKKNKNKIKIDFQPNYKQMTVEQWLQLNTRKAGSHKQGEKRANNPKNQTWDYYF